MNDKFLEDLEAEWEANAPEVRFADIFKQAARQFKGCYTRYVNNYDSSEAKLRKIRESSDAGDREKQRYLTKQISNPDANGKDVTSFLIQPVQRVLRYRLLLTDLLEHTDPGHPDEEPVREALDKICELAKVRWTTRTNRAAGAAIYCALRSVALPVSSSARRLAGRAPPAACDSLLPRRSHGRRARAGRHSTRTSASPTTLRSCAPSSPNLSSLTRSRCVRSCSRTSASCSRRACWSRRASRTVSAARSSYSTIFSSTPLPLSKGAHLDRRATSQVPTPRLGSQVRVAILPGAQYPLLHCAFGAARAWDGRDPILCHYSMPSGICSSRTARGRVCSLVAYQDVLHAHPADAVGSCCVIRCLRKGTIKLHDGARVESLPKTEEMPHAFAIVEKGGKGYTWLAESAEEKADWYKAIGDAISAGKQQSGVGPSSRGAMLLDVPTKVRRHWSATATATPRAHRLPARTYACAHRQALAAASLPARCDATAGAVLLASLRGKPELERGAPNSARCLPLRSRSACASRR